MVVKLQSFRHDWFQQVVLSNISVALLYLHTGWVFLKKELEKLENSKSFLFYYSRERQRLRRWYILRWKSCAASSASPCWKFSLEVCRGVRLAIKRVFGWHEPTPSRSHRRSVFLKLSNWQPKVHFTISVADLSWWPILEIRDKLTKAFAFSSLRAKRATFYVLYG